MMAFSTPVASLVREHPEMQTELGTAAIYKARNGDFDEALSIFDALAKVDPENRTISLNRAVILDQQADDLRKKGHAEAADKCDDDALRFYEQAMDAEPALPDAFFNAGFYYLKKYNYTRAKDCFETFIALTHTPGIGAPRDAVGNLLGEDEMDDQTMDRLAVTMNYKLKRAAELLNHIEEQHLATDEFRLAYECINRSEEEQGIAHIRTFLERNPTVWNAWFLLGWGLRRKERWTEAKEAFVLALKHGEAGGTVLVDTYNEMAICCLELKEYAEAEKLLYRAINIESENTKIMSNMGFVCLKQDKPDEALSWFTTVLEFDPEDELAQKMVEELT